VETRRFYEKASARTQDASIRQLLDDLANEEREHEERAQELDKQKLPGGAMGSRDCRHCRTGSDHLGSQALHGYALGFGSAAGRLGGSAGLHHRRSDREVVSGISQLFAARTEPYFLFLHFLYLFQLHEEQHKDRPHPDGEWELNQLRIADRTSPWNGEGKREHSCSREDSEDNFCLEVHSF